MKNPITKCRACTAIFAPKTEPFELRLWTRHGGEYHLQVKPWMSTVCCNDCLDRFAKDYFDKWSTDAEVDGEDTDDDGYFDPYPASPVQPGLGDFNAFLLASFERISNRMRKGLLLERCEGLWLTGNRCRNWASQIKNSRFVCTTHAKGKLLLMGEKVETKDFNPVFYFAGCATSAADVKIELMKTLPHDWLVELGIATQHSEG